MLSPDTPIRIRVCVALVEGGEILLVEHTKDGRRNWLLPGGGLEHGETLHDAAARELLEETGLEVRPTRLLFVAESIAPDGHRHIVHVCFLAERTGGKERPCDDPRVTGLVWLPLKEFETVELYPAFNTEILAALESPSALYFGNRWV